MCGSRRTTSSFGMEIMLIENEKRWEVKENTRTQQQDIEPGVRRDEGSRHILSEGLYLGEGAYGFQDAHSWT